uniref:Uncharacterized protein n=1 Tax=Arundo donax TaxID=35708 RepID=A0A0A9DY64_ARUDO
MSLFALLLLGIKRASMGYQDPVLSKTTSRSKNKNKKRSVTFQFF